MSRVIEIEPRTPGWYDIRQRGLGASDAAAALNRSRWVSSYALWCEKTGETERLQNLGVRGRVGQLAEPLIAELFEDETGLVTYPHSVIIQSEEHPFMLCTPDRFIEGDPKALAEFKTVDPRAADEWDDGAVPLEYILQGQHALAASDGVYDRVHFGVLIGFGDFRVLTMDRDNDLINAMVTDEMAFWELVTERIPPATDGSTSTGRALAARYPGMNPDPIELGDYGKRLVDMWKSAKAASKLSEDRVDDIANELKELMGDHTEGNSNGLRVVTFRPQTRKEHTVKESTFRVLREVKGRMS